ncbi:hypothetical protein [Mesorhizobium sp. WSM3862]|uniref:hypothetical protein n=1 Tax=Mesorhizobium sp. WSM3862 TaxID=632858 RepID=UPI000BAEB964|nr:hypothetical protein [Mesorhizobium sp. WSM3862]PBB96449.1 hypothetical protein CK224_19195 [Mesorhizobium sp. WSM3862]
MFGDSGQFYPFQPFQFMEGLLMPHIGLTQYVTFFSEYTVGAQPSDWTSRWNAGGFTAVVQTVAGSLAGKALRITKTAANRQALSWDRVPSTANVDVLLRMRPIEAWSASENLIGPWMRGSGSAGSEGGYRFEMGGESTGTLYSGALGKYVSGTFTALGTNTNGPSPNLAANSWIWMRGRINGTSLSRRMWHDGVAEPGTWDETVTDSSIASAGFVGVTQISANPNVEIDFFSIGLNGDTALGP